MLLGLAEFPPFHSYLAEEEVRLRIRAVERRSFSQRCLGVVELFGEKLQLSEQNKPDGIRRIDL